MKTEFKALKGVRVMLSLPEREDLGIEVSPELQKQLDDEFWLKTQQLEVYAVGESVEGIRVGDKVFIPTEEIKRGSVVEINKQQKLIVNSMAIAIIW